MAKAKRTEAEIEKAERAAFERLRDKIEARDDAKRDAAWDAIDKQITELKAALPAKIKAIKAEFKKQMKALREARNKLR